MYSRKTINVMNLCLHALHNIAFPLTTIIVVFSIAPSGTNSVGRQYQLTCTFIGSIHTATFLWFGPPNDGTLPSDNSETRMVSDVMSSGSTHTSILQFDPLQSSHEGNYTCQVTVGTVTEMRSIQVNVEGKC